MALFVLIFCPESSWNTLLGIIRDVDPSSTLYLVASESPYKLLLGINRDVELVIIFDRVFCPASS